MTDSAELLAQLEELHPKKIDLSLGRIEHLCEALGRPQDHLPPVIHVAGTNGKGSVTAFLDAMLTAAGKRVHVFTSPHLVRFHERIRLSDPDGTTEPISEATLIDILVRTEKANNGNPITFFEITTAAAFLTFSEHPADFLILETGLGGRLDATNIIEKPALTILTPISIDHTGFLGEKIQQIAAEKAGILKPGIPCVVAPQTNDVFEVIEKRSDETGSPLLAAGRHWDCYEQHGRLVYQDEDTLLDLPLPNLIGRHQYDNAGTAITAARNLTALKINPQHLETGLTNAHWPARLERLDPGKLHLLANEDSEIWLDGGHNPAAGKVLAETMAELEERAPRPLHLICGMMHNKDASAFFKAFDGLAQHVVTVSIPGQENAFSAEDLAKQARSAGLPASPAENVYDAIRLGRAQSDEPARILICGSLYLAGSIYAIHQAEPTITKKSPDNRQGPDPLGL